MVLVAALTASPILRLGLAFGPSVVALLLVVIEGPAVRALAALPEAEIV